MSEAIAKLQPHRTMHLQGFDGYGCTACLHSASATGFSIDGVWGEQSDFAVLILWDADNQFEHPRMRYLPDWKFDGMVLSFRLAMVNCVPIDSDYYKWLDWGTLNVLYGDGTEQQVSLAGCATAAVGSYAQPTAVFDLTGAAAYYGDIVGLAWLGQYPNYWVATGDTPAMIAAGLAASINGQTGTSHVTAAAAGAQITLTYGNALGANGNRVGVYGWVYSPSSGTLAWSPAWTLFSGGTSPTVWDISIDFSAKLTQPQNVQRMWITFAPPITPDVGAFTGGTFSAVVTNWAVTDANGRRGLKVAGPGSVRIEETDAWVTRAGYWEDAGAQWWSQGFAIRSAGNVTGRSLTIETHCGATHDIWVGTRLDVNCGKVSASLDGGGAVTLDAYGSGAGVRRKLFAGVSAGQHSVAITLLSTKNALSSGWYFYFDFLECVVAGDVPDAPQTRTDIAVATDFDTDNTYKLPPARLVWSIAKSGLVGKIDHYLGVFWWPVRKMLTAASAWAQVTTITLSGAPTFSATFGVTMGGTTLTHVCLVGDTLATVARAFALAVNQGSTIFWAVAAGNVLTLTGLAGEAQYHVAVTAPAAAGMTAAVTTVNGAAVEVDWGVDDAAGAPVNTAVAAWHADYFATLVAAGMTCVAAFGQELVNPPAAWVQQFHDGTLVATATGFGTLSSSQIAFSAAVQVYMAAAYNAVATLMEVAGLTAWLQFGEVGWWFNAGGSPASMAYYDADTAAAAAAGLGRALYVFAGPGDDPGVNGGADAGWLAGRLAGYVAAIRAAVAAAHSGAKFELLWPLDVNLPETRRLNWAVNLPGVWKVKAGSGFDSFLCEGFQFGGTDRDIDQVTRCARYPFTELGWDRASCGYLMGLFNAGWPWQRDYLAGAGTRVPTVKIWAWDHVCLYGRMVQAPAWGRRARVWGMAA